MKGTNSNGGVGIMAKEPLRATTLGEVCGRSVTVLIDTGADRNFISEDITAECGLAINSSDRVVKLADGSVHRVIGETVTKIKLGLRNYSFSFIIIPTGHDIIIGIETMEALNIVINVAEKQVTLGPQRETLRLGLVRTLTTDLDTELITPRELKKIEKDTSRIEEDSIRLTVVYVRERTLETSCASMSTEGTRGTEHHQQILITCEDADLMKVIQRKYREIFRLSLPEDETLQDIPATRVLKEPIINTGDHAPINLAGFKLTAEERNELQSQVEKLLAAGFITESSSSWGFPVLFVKKKDGTMRMCVDY